MKCEQQLGISKSLDFVGSLMKNVSTAIICEGELEYLMSGARVTGPDGDRTIEDAELYKCSSCGDVTVKT